MLEAGRERDHKKKNKRGVPGEWELFSINDLWQVDKMTDANTVTACFVCGHDLRYDNDIHRINMKWYCAKCYVKYIRGEQNVKT